jgi:hypothetical protein
MKLISFRVLRNAKRNEFRWIPYGSSESIETTVFIWAAKMCTMLRIFLPILGQNYASEIIVKLFRETISNFLPYFGKLKIDFHIHLTVDWMLLRCGPKQGAWTKTHRLKEPYRSGTIFVEPEQKSWIVMRWGSGFDGSSVSDPKPHSIVG